MKISYREMKESEHQFLDDMLYEALYVPKGKAKFPKSIINEPAIKKYIEHWDKKEGDVAIVAIINDELIGAVWGRKFTESNQGYGFISSEIPEISMAVKRDYRNFGIGSRLLEEIELKYIENGVRKISLSVSKLNLAKRLYDRNGYEFQRDCGSSITMVKDIC